MEEAAPRQAACISRVVVSAREPEERAVSLCRGTGEGAWRKGTHTLTYELTGLEGIGSGQGALQVQGKVGVQGGGISGSTDLAAGYGSVSMGGRHSPEVSGNCGGGLKCGIRFSF